VRYTGTAVTVGAQLVARFVPSNIEAARRALDAASVPFAEHEVVPALIESRAGELATLSARLAEAGIAVRCLYLTATRENVMQIAIVADQPELIRRLLGNRVGG
jgi:hypothetical protein